ncbi:hypothetical protein C8E08_4655 [Paracidovorax citrulli]|nr:hypothetical protein CQB05_02460 [Paracidovorax citrulli]PVY67220.1 hypothetical protein C8E08_4655 [Paracidovorax citrulli]QCX09132.1 hypothetical protein APS58_0155 [Paracidovorax citrulli]REG68619.1 hypothetical protein C8E07_1736 [Paracidovorax citrulli]RLJ93174.1 hypothetical protein C8E06_1736 [Paracidovorax citrulli]
METHTTPRSLDAYAHAPAPSVPVAREPLRYREHAGRRVGILVWPSGDGWRGAWSMGSGAWYAVRGRWGSEDLAAEKTFIAARSSLGQDGLRRRRPSATPAHRPAALCAETEEAGERGQAPALRAASEQWSELRRDWQTAEMRLARRQSAICLGEGPAENAEDAKSLRDLEREAESARQRMDDYLNVVLRMLRPQAGNASS